MTDYSFFQSISFDLLPKSKEKSRNVDGNVYLLEMQGSSSISVLDSTMKRLTNKYATCGWQGSKVSDYSAYSKGWRGKVWDVIVLRACLSYLQKIGFGRSNALEMIRNKIYMTDGFATSMGRPAGTKGESVGDGRKSNGTKKTFKLGKHNRQWMQIALCKSTCAVIDLCSDMRMVYAANHHKKAYKWSRQKNLTFISMVNPLPEFSLPSMREFFYEDHEEVL